MNTKKIITVAAFVVPALLSSGAVVADDTIKDLKTITCKAVMKNEGGNQDVVIAFMHGYLMGKSGGTRVDTVKLGEASDAFIDACLDNPKSIAIKVLADKTRGVTKKK